MDLSAILRKHRFLYPRLHLQVRRPLRAQNLQPPYLVYGQFLFTLNYFNKKSQHGQNQIDLPINTFSKTPLSKSFCEEPPTTTFPLSRT